MGGGTIVFNYNFFNIFIIPFNFFVMLIEMGGVAILLGTLAIFCWVVPFRIRIVDAILEIREFPWRQSSFDLNRTTKVTELFNHITGDCSQLIVEFGSCEPAAFIDVSLYEPAQIQLLKRRIDDFICAEKNWGQAPVSHCH